MKNRWKSRKFILALASVAVILLKGLGYFALDDDSIWQMIAIVLGWIGIEGAVDFVRVLRSYTIVLDNEEEVEEDAKDET